MNFNSFTRVTILLASSRSYASLAKAVMTINESVYDVNDPADAADLVVFADVYDRTGDLTHFELTGAALDLFQVGISYGTLEERKRLEQLDYSLETSRLQSADNQ